MFPPQEGSLCGELIKMLEDLALVRVFTRTPTEEGLSFEMLNKLPTVDGGQESFSSHPVLWKMYTPQKKKQVNTVYDDKMMDLVKYFIN